MSERLANGMSNSGPETAPPAYMSPLDFLRTLHWGADHASKHYTHPLLDTQAANRLGFAAWAQHYKACIEAIEK
jgi:hypothetical protein